MEKEEQLKAYFKEIVLRIQIALATIVIRTTPFGVCAKEHAKSIQALYKLNFLSTEQGDPLNKYEQEVLHLQQKELLSRLWRLTKTDVLKQHKNASDLINVAAQYSPTNKRFTTESEETVQELGTSEMLLHIIEPNLQFIHAIAHLTSVVNSCSHMPMDEYKKILSSASCDSNSKPCTEKDVPDDTEMFNSSAIKDVGDLKDKNGVSSDVIKYIMHSSNGRKVLVHSVHCVLQYLSERINAENEAQLEKIIVSWKGSLLEHAVKVVLDLVDCAAGEDGEQNQYHQMCIDCIENIINGILESNTFHKHHIWEQTCTAILEIGNNKYICFSMINNLVEKIKCVNENLRSNNSSSKECARSLNIEKSFYLFYLLEHFIRIWSNFHYSDQLVTNISKTLPKNNSYVNVMNLWRKKWSYSLVTEEEKKHGNEEKKIISKWKDVLQDCLMNSKQQYPLIMTYLWECCQLLESIES